MFDGWQYYSAVWFLLVLALAVGLALFWRKPRLPEFVCFNSSGVERWRIIGSFDEPRLRQEPASP